MLYSPRRPIRPCRAGAWATLLCALLSFAGVTAAHAQPPPTSPPSPSPQATKPSGEIDVLGLLDTQLANLVSDARSAVVSIEGTVDLKATPEMASQSDDPPGQAEHASIRMPVTGSGFLLPGGIVVTTAEVVAGMHDPAVILAAERRVKVSDIKCDPHANVAILRVPDAGPATGLRWGDSLDVRAGNLAITIGNQAGFAESASLGMISATDQHARDQSRHYDHLIQFQGSLGIGESGSPLLNTRGEVIGMVIGMAVGPEERMGGRYFGFHINASKPQHQQTTASSDNERAPSSPITTQMIMIGGSNMGFALPSNYLKAAIDALVKGETRSPSRGWFGVLPDKGNSNGLVIAAVYIGSPADRAGVHPGDKVTAINGRPVSCEDELKRESDRLLEGQEITLQVERKQQTLLLHLHIVAHPDNATIEHMPRHTLPSPVGLLPDALPCSSSLHSVRSAPVHRGITC